MDDKLETIISFYEEEKINLQKLIDECVSDFEFLMAHNHSKALYLVQNKIDILKGIQDKLYDDKKFLELRIQNLEKRIKNEGQLGISIYTEDYLNEVRNKLEVINQKTDPILTATENSISETLIKLLTKKVKRFKLVLRKDKNLYIEFTYTKKILKLTFPFVKQHLRSQLLNKYDVNKFFKMGFRFNSNFSKLILLQSANDIGIIEEINKILSIVVFEVFNPDYFENKSFIEL